MVDVHSSLVIPTHSYGPLASCGWTGSEDLLIFPWKKKMFSGWHARTTGCRDIALNSRVMETATGRRGWLFRMVGMVAGGCWDYVVLPGIFWMIGFASVVISWVMNCFLMVQGLDMVSKLLFRSSYSSFVQRVLTLCFLIIFFGCCWSILFYFPWFGCLIFNGGG